MRVHPFIAAEGVYLSFFQEGGGGGGCTLAFQRGVAESDLAIHGVWRSAAIREYYPAEVARGRVAAALAVARLVAQLSRCSHHSL